MKPLQTHWSQYSQKKKKNQQVQDINPSQKRQNNSAAQVIYGTV